MKVIPVKGAIVSNNNKRWYDAYNIEATAPKDIELPDTGEDIEVHINSGGGSVFDGSEIYTLLRSYPGKVYVKVVGLAASAASVIAMAGDEIEMSPTAQMMIHNSSTLAYGDRNDFSDEVNTLKSIDESIASAYALKTGRDIDDILQLMSQETWFNAKGAVEAGFADKVMFEDAAAPQFVASVSTVLPQAIIDELMANEAKNEVPDNQFSQLMARLDALETRFNEFANKPISEATITIDAEQLGAAINDALYQAKLDDPKEKSPFGKFF